MIQSFLTSNLSRYLLTYPLRSHPTVSLLIDFNIQVVVPIRLKHFRSMKRPIRFCLHAAMKTTGATATPQKKSRSTGWRCGSINTYFTHGCCHQSTLLLSSTQAKKRQRKERSCMDINGDLLERAIHNTINSLLPSQYHNTPMYEK